MLFSIRTLAPVAILHDGFIQAYRVACTSAIATRRMAREDASDLGLLGSAGQAWAHLVAMRAVRKLQRVRIYSPNPERRAIFAERARRELGLDACAVQSAREAVAGADLVVAATNTNSSIIDGAWLEPGAHVVSIVSGDQKTPRRELDDETMRRAAVVVVHSKEIAGHADIGVPLQKGILKPEGIAELWEIVAGRLPGRRSESDITVFKNNIGLGLQFAAVGPRIYERARAAGIGHELPSSLFLETLKP
jgi:ornithine cyclodeaminase/alanine dehydrogenase-like protein (mu-crystallin family)